MKAVISSTWDDLYLFYLPITTWCWNKLGVDVICFLPRTTGDLPQQMILIAATQSKVGLRQKHCFFDAPEHKKATYAQCSRLYGAATGLSNDDEILITSDIDMAVFKLPPYNHDPNYPIQIFGTDLVPDGQFPMCYATAQARDWKSVMKIGDKSYQQCLDELLGHIEADHFRGNYWGKDQETLWQNACDVSMNIPRARPGTQFASCRIDRDDAYFMERLSPDIVDYHLHRPGYTQDNFDKILSVLKYFYPNDDLGWMISYHAEYLKILHHNGN